MTQNSSPVSVAISRRMLWEMLAAGGPELAHELDSRGIAARGTCADVVDGVRAFLDKRPPKFPMKVSADMPDYYKRRDELGSAQPLVDDAAAS
jgi:hypothetical protein